MTTSIPTGDSAIVRRAHDQLEMRRRQLAPLFMPYAIAFFCILGIFAACCSEFFSATIGFKAAFPMKSDGTSLAADFMSFRYPIVLCLLFGDVMLHAVPNRIGVVLNGFLNSVGFVAILLLLFGIGAFVFSATFLTLGSGDGQEFVGHLVGLALGTASGMMFTLSFVASHAMMSKLFGVMPVIAAGRAERARIKAADAMLQDLEGRRGRVEDCRSIVHEMSKPDALEHRAANEAGVIVGAVAAEAHDLCASRGIRGDDELGPDDHSDVPDVPLRVFQQRYADLKPYTAQYFFNLLKQKEA